ncbi:MAG TPA: 30S ribosomal protein S20 [Acidobacteriota bacterium]|nr:30S ribosomal protein S20 [Acidobacteriota bacterium]HRR56633.1 30S ribosomal protein S20 [Acidobacteriota bacterium]HRV07052.1 30S ribosomal protein S20 [Acidobacteriota bacterium]
MANTKSALKRIRQNEIRRLRNRSRRSRMRTFIKKFRRMLEEKRLDEAKAFLPQVYAVIDRTAQKGTIHPNAAARYKSRLTQKLKALTAESESA